MLSKVLALDKRVEKLLILDLDLKKEQGFLGGAIQKFALGGLAQKNKVGFAILDPDEGGADPKRFCNSRSN